MNILFDFGHPANVHYFKNLIAYLNEKGHTIQVLARDKEVTIDLLNSYGIPFISKGTGGYGFFDRVGYTLKSLHLIRKQIRLNPPDLCISHASPYLAVLAALHGVPHIMFNDTEKAFLFKKVIKWCKPEVYVPDCFLLNDDLPVTRVPSYMELAYLHPDLFEPDLSVTDLTGSNFVLMRFVSNRSTHDLGKNSLDWSYKREIIRAIERESQLWISSEDPLPDDLERYQLPLAPGKIHHAIAAAKLVVGDSATMSSEAAVLGIPSIHIHENRWGYVKELEERYGLITHFESSEEGRKRAMQKIVMLSGKEGSICGATEKRNQMLSQKVNMASYMIDIVEAKLNSIKKRG